MQFGWPVFQKPPIGTQLDRTNPLLKGLLWYAPCWENCGAVITDLIGNVNLSLVSGGTPVWTPGTSASTGAGPKFATTTSYYSATLPKSLQIQAPITLVFGYKRTGNASAGNSPIFGLFINNTASGNIGPAMVSQNGSTSLELFGTTGTAFTYATPSFNPTTGVSYTIVFVCGVTTYTLYAFPTTGAPITPLTASWSTSQGNPTYAATANIALGGGPNWARYPNGVVHFAGVYNRALTANEAAAWGQNPWQIFQPRSGVAALASSTGHFTASPTSIYSNNASGQTITLTGFGTSWSSGGTTFSVSGVSGATKASQSVTSTTSATVTVDTGSGTGTLTISDGSLTSTVTVASPSATASPTAIPTNHAGNITLTLTGTGTNWGGGTTFTVSGVSGVAKVSQNIASTTSATVVVTTGSTAGTLTVTDGIVSANITVEAATFSLSTTSGAYSVPVSITATGSPGSVWTQENASTLFTTPGTYGDSISTIAVTANNSATFTLNPGTATGSLVITETPNGATTTYTINGVAGSLRVRGPWAVQTAASTLFTSQPVISFSFFVRFNATPSSTDAILTTQYGYNLMELLSTSDEAYFQVYGTGGAGSYMLTFLPTAVYHVALTWGYGSGSSGTWNIYVNGVRKATGTPSANFGSGGASQWLQVGSSISTAVDYQIQNLAIWYYELTATDVAHLRDGVYNPGTLIGSSTGVLQSPKAWWLLGNATSGTPASGDNSFVDVTGNGYNFAGLPGSGTGASSANASYAAPLVYTPLTTVTPYVAKSGQLAVFATSSAISTTSTIAGTVSINRNSTTLSLAFALSGTVSVAYNSTALTTSVAQPTGNVSSFIGSQILIGADTSGTVYTITAGSGTSWTLSRGYQCTTNAVNSNAVLVSPAQNTLWIGAQIQISGDSSNTTYTIVSGGGTTFTISPAYAGSSNASGATATLIQTGAAAPVQSVTADPTIKVQFGGTGTAETVQTWGPWWAPVSQCAPFAAWVLQCGPVASLRINNPGSNYTAPSVSASGGGGSGLTFGTPVLSGGVTSYTRTSGGSGYANITATYSGGAITGFTIVSGGTGYVAGATTITISGGGGTGATAIPVIPTSGVITGVTLTNPGSGYTSAPTVSITGMGCGVIVSVAAPSIAITGTLANGSTTVTSVSSTTGLYAGMIIMGTGTYPNFIASVGTGTLTLTSPAVGNSVGASLHAIGKTALATATVAGGTITAVNMFVPGAGYSSAPLVSFSGGGGSGASFTAHVNNIIVSIPVTNGGSGYTSPPTIAITDSTGSGAVAVPLMGGAQPSDVVTYSAAASWLSTSVSAAAAATNAAVTNYAGQLESCVGGSYNFSQPSNQRTMPLGMNICEVADYYTPHHDTNNWLKRAYTSLNSTNRIATTTPDGRPITITGTSASPSYLLVVNLSVGDDIDSVAAALPVADGYNGRFWTFIADEIIGDDPGNPPTLMTVGMFGYSITVTGGLVSAGTQATGVTGLAVVSGGSGYTDAPTVTISGGGGTGATGYALINSNGQVTWVNVVSPGSGYTSTPTVTLSGGGGTGATATATIGGVMLGRTWQFTAVQTVTYNVGLELTFYNSAQTGTYKYSLINECLFGPATTAAYYPAYPPRSIQFSPNATTSAWITTASSKTPAVARFLSEMVDDMSNIIDASDIKNPYDFSWRQRPDTTTIYTSATPEFDPTGTRTVLINTVRTYSTSGGFPSGWNVTWTSPNVYVSNPGTGTSTAVYPTPGWASSGGYGPSQTAGGPYYVSPPNPGWIFPPSGFFVVELVCTAPHYLKTGQIVKISNLNTALTFQISDGTTTTTLPTSQICGGNFVAYVTSATTFVIAALDSNLSAATASLPGGLRNVVGEFTVNLSVNMIVPDLEGLPFEVAATTAAALPGCDLWVNIPWGATDVCVAAIATRTLANFPPGRKIHVEYANEPWNSATPTYYYLIAAGQLGIWSNTALNTIQAYTVRAGQVHAIFDTVFTAGRSRLGDRPGLRRPVLLSDPEHDRHHQHGRHAKPADPGGRGGCRSLYSAAVGQHFADRGRISRVDFRHDRAVSGDILRLLHVCRRGDGYRDRYRGKPVLVHGLVAVHQHLHDDDSGAPVLGPCDGQHLSDATGRPTRNRDAVRHAHHGRDRAAYQWHMGQLFAVATPLQPATGNRLGGRATRHALANVDCLPESKPNPACSLHGLLPARGQVYRRQQ